MSEEEDKTPPTRKRRRLHPDVQKLTQDESKLKGDTRKAPRPDKHSRDTGSVRPPTEKYSRDTGSVRPPGRQRPPTGRSTGRQRRPGSDSGIIQPPGKQRRPGSGSGRIQPPGKQRPSGSGSGRIQPPRQRSTTGRPRQRPTGKHRVQKPNGRASGRHVVQAPTAEIPRPKHTQTTDGPKRPDLDGGLGTHSIPTPGGVESRDFDDGLRTYIIPTPAYKKPIAEEQTVSFSQVQQRVALDARFLIGHDLPFVDYDLRLTRVLGIGRQGTVLEGVPYKDGECIMGNPNAERGTPEYKGPPALAVKITNDTSDKGNDQLQQAAIILEQLRQDQPKGGSFPLVYGHGVLDSEDLSDLIEDNEELSDLFEDREPAFMIMPLLQANPLPFLRGKNPNGQIFIKPSRQGDMSEEEYAALPDGIHPNIAFTIYYDLLKYICLLNDRDLGHGDLNASQVMLFMSPLKKGEEVSQYLDRLGYMQWLTQVVDNDTIRKLRVASPDIALTPGAADPWFLLPSAQGKYTKRMDVYSATATLFHLITGEPILKGYPAEGNTEQERAVDWAREVRERSLPWADQTSTDEPVFTRNRIYKAIQGYYDIEAPKRVQGVESTPSAWQKLGKMVAGLLGKEETKEELTDLQRKVESIIDILCAGLSPLDSRPLPENLIRRIEKLFPPEEKKVLFYNPHIGDYESHQRSVVQPLPGRPEYKVA